MITLIVRTLFATMAGSKPSSHVEDTLARFLGINEVGVEE